MTEQSPQATTTSPPPRGRTAAGYAVLGLAMLAALAVGAYLFVSGGGDDAPADATGTTTPGGSTIGPLEPTRPEIGKPAPNFALPDARDPSIIRQLADYRGQAVVINWYASWCGPCKAEIPDFLEAQAALGDQVVFLGVNYLEPRDKASASSMSSARTTRRSLIPGAPWPSTTGLRGCPARFLSTRTASFAP